MPNKKSKEEVLAAFWTRVDIRGPDECWPWKEKAVNGYGQVRVWGGVTYAAHRIAWFLDRKRNPGKWKIRHKCDNGICCNPKHLVRGTQKQNVRDSIIRGRISERKGICNNFAKLDDDKVRWAREVVLSKRMTLKQAAAQLNVNFTTIHLAVRRHTWAHVE
jgi:hypothetical protein